MRYLRATHVDEAVSAVRDGALPLAGGSVLVPLIARGALTPPAVVDVGRLAPLTEVRDEDVELRIGASVTLAAVARLAGGGEAALPQSAAGVGNPLVRRVGTIGGNVASRLPTADLVPALLVLEARAVWAGSPNGGSPLADALEDAGGGRLLTAVTIRRDPSRQSGFVKFAGREATGAAIASVALAAGVRDGVVAEPRVAVGGVVAPGRLASAEAALAGRPWPEAADEATAAAVEECAARSGLPADDYRLRLVGAGLRRLLRGLGDA